MLHPIKTKFQKLSIPLSMLALLTTISLLATSAEADCGHDHWNQAKHSEKFEMHMITLHDELGLSESQQVAWQDFTEALKPKAHEVRHEHANPAELTTPEQLDHMLAMIKLRQEKMVSHVQSIEKFYSTLTSVQQKIFDQKFSQHLFHSDKP